MIRRVAALLIVTIIAATPLREVPYDAVRAPHFLSPCC